MPSLICTCPLATMRPSTSSVSTSSAEKRIGAEGRADRRPCSPGGACAFGGGVCADAGKGPAASVSVSAASASTPAA